MSPTLPHYERLPGAGYRHGGLLAAVRLRSRLYLAPDHLLLVDSTGYSEAYKRFYFRDIQAITLRKTPRALRWTAVFGVLGLCFLPGLMLASANEVRFLWGGGFGLMALGLLVNLLWGQSVVCHLRTAVQVEELPPLCRLPRAQRVLARLEPLILAAQAETAPAEPAQATAPAPRPQAQPAPSAAGQAMPAKEPADTRLHRVLFWALVADGPMTVLATLWRHSVTETLSALLMLGLVVTALITVIRQRRMDLPRGLRLAPIIALGLLAFSFLVSLGVGGALVAREGMEVLTRDDFMLRPGILTMTILFTTANVTLGAVGLSALRDLARRRTAPADAPSPPAAGPAPAAPGALPPP